MVCKEGDDSHLAAALGTEERIRFIDFPDHLGPASAGNPGALLLDDQKLMTRFLRLAHLAPMSVGVEAELC